MKIPSSSDIDPYTVILIEMEGVNPSNNQYISAQSSLCKLVLNICHFPNFRVVVCSLSSGEGKFISKTRGELRHLSDNMKNLVELCNEIKCSPFNKKECRLFYKTLVLPNEYPVDYKEARAMTGYNPYLLYSCRNTSSRSEFREEILERGVDFVATLRPDIDAMYFNLTAGHHLPYAITVLTRYLNNNFDIEDKQLFQKNFLTQSNIMWETEGKVTLAFPLLAQSLLFLLTEDPRSKYFGSVDTYQFVKGFRFEYLFYNHVKSKSLDIDIQYFMKPITEEETTKGKATLKSADPYKYMSIKVINTSVYDSREAFEANVLYCMPRNEWYIDAVIFDEENNCLALLQLSLQPYYNHRSKVSGLLKNDHCHLKKYLKMAEEFSRDPMVLYLYVSPGINTFPSSLQNDACPEISVGVLLPKSNSYNIAKDLVQNVHVNIYLF